MDRWLVALLAMLTVLANNACNEANSVGFYQITKLLIVPSVICLERLNGGNKVYDKKILLSLLVTSVGVGIATVSDFEINVRGSILAACSVLLTAQYQSWQQSKQLEHDVSPTQITHSVVWPQFVLGSGSTLLLDVACPWMKTALLLRPEGLLEHQVDGKCLPVWIMVCCGLSVAMNLSTYGLLGKVGPVTYQVIGQVKTCVIVALGYLFFDVDAPRIWVAIRFAGVGVAVSGALAYFVFKSQEAPAGCNSPGMQTTIGAATSAKRD